MDEYYLGSSEGEFNRLKIQSNVFNRTSTTIIDQFFYPGLDVVELGSGVGGASFMIAQKLLNEGSLRCFEREERYAEYLQNQVKSSIFTNIDIYPEDITTYKPNFSFDRLYIRAVLHHLKAPFPSISSFISSLKVGGLMVIEEPLIRYTGQLPTNSILMKWGELNFQRIMDVGGKLAVSLDIAEKLKEYVEKYGFKVIVQHISQTNLKLKEEKSILTQWLDMHRDELLRKKAVNQSEFDDLYIQMKKLVSCKDEPVFYVPMMQIVAQKVV
ncbi:methyltransferase domain-containing protein [Fangia hongkongensis]|uniref:methyltransferase domain-containing protein n=1 Tax=Fangia hongkongensis TaxID=270495 RepID=UPI00037CB744|nr:methyltransferase domain-containing protein [Fangia hongkongensis]MBK2123689.1 methyltransferase domain-containing protein [Fangia hongkongensis]